VVVGLVTGGAVIAKREAKQEPAPASIVVPAPAPVEPKPTAVEPIPVTVPEVQKTVEAVEAVEPSEPVRRETRAAPVADIREEIKLLDQARSAVRSGNNAQALRALSKYEQRFPRGQFRQEVQVLRMEALKQSGESERASALAKKFLAEHPNSPHVERVEHVGN